MATLIFGIGLLVGSHTYVSQPEQFARLSSVPSRTVVEPKMEPVGRITGMVDCQWTGTAFDSPVVPLGRKYELASGLVEITYDTGAKVILQGPVTYEVESAAGGYLAVGKLTGKVEHETAKGFSVRTPTAVVTDLGTEFGVEVSKEGNTLSHVFRGTVEVQPTADGRNQGSQSIRLTENESAEVKKQPIGGKVTVHHVAADPASFVRAEQLPKLVEEQRLRPLHRWQAYSRQLRKDPALLAYYTFEAAVSNQCDAAEPLGRRRRAGRLCRGGGMGLRPPAGKVCPVLPRSPLR